MDESSFLFTNFFRLKWDEIQSGPPYRSDARHLSYIRDNIPIVIQRRKRQRKSFGVVRPLGRDDEGTGKPDPTAYEDFR